MELKEKTIQNIKKNTGLSIKEIQEMTTEEIDVYFAQRSNLKKIPIIDIPLVRVGGSSMKEIDRRLSKI